MLGQDLIASLNANNKTKDDTKKKPRKKHHFHATAKSKVPVEIIQEIRDAQVRGDARVEVHKRYPDINFNTFRCIWEGFTAAHIIGRLPK